MMQTHMIDRDWRRTRWIFTPHRLLLRCLAALPWLAATLCTAGSTQAQATSEGWISYSPHGLKDPLKPLTLKYTEPIPPGYRVEDAGIGKGLIVGGGLLLLPPYVASAVLGAAAPATGWPLFIPGMGPFIYTATYRGNPLDGRFWIPAVLPDIFFIVDGLAQSAGIGLMIIGIYRKNKILVRNDVRYVQSWVRPELMISPSSVALRFSF